MTGISFAIKSFFHYLRYNLTVAIGVAISTAILTGGLIVGDSVRFSLEQNTRYRLGQTRVAISAGDRFFTSNLAESLQEKLTANWQNDISAPGTNEMGGILPADQEGISQFERNEICAPLLQLNGVATADGGRLRIDRIQVNGINRQFDLIADTSSFFGNLSGNEVIISENMAERLAVGEGDFIVLRIQKASTLPLNAPFVSATNTTVSARARVKAIAGLPELGRFSMKISQTAPFNVFIDLDFLNQLMELEGKANLILISNEGNQSQEEIVTCLRNVWQPEDAGLMIRSISSLNEIELYSQRVFIEPAIINAFQKVSTNQYFILTYFVNSIGAGKNQTPYSFVSTLAGKGIANTPEKGTPISPVDENLTISGGETLSEDGIIVNEWLASDLEIIPGDTIRLDYYVPGPLRRLEEHSISLRVEGIVPIRGKYGDMSLMPDLPGLSDAGHCRDWEAGIPIDLEKIRDKDEDYWNIFKGTPKAFISIHTAGKLWQNRFGDYTAIRFPSSQIDNELLVKAFQNYLDPADLGIHAELVQESGMEAARNGVDFSQLFIALSFFILISSIILTALLFHLNLASRISQAGTMATWGYSKRLIKRIYLMEGGFIAIIGGLPGVLLAIVYTRFVFNLLERVWSDIVRTSILEISIQPLTLVTGFLVCILISWVTIYFVLRTNLKKEIVQIQRGLKFHYRSQSILFKLLPGSLPALICVVLVLTQVLNERQLSTPVFLMAGGMLFLSLILFTDQLLRIPQRGQSTRLTVSKIVQRNIARNRQRSLTIILLFSLGTFSVVLTGSNKRDPHREIGDKSGGTGGFQYFAEATIPILHDLNNPDIRVESGLEGDYSFVQFRKNDGDDASCLNLNRISNPVLLGVDPALMDGRFSFVATTPDLDPERPWESLEKELDGGIIPAIADQTVIQWGLGKKMGDTLFYQNETGDTLGIKLIGGIAPSVLQGNMIISDQHFLSNFPSSSGASVYLVEVMPGDSIDPNNDLTRAFRDNGWFMTETFTRLAEFESVQNTYLSIFTFLGVLALLLGTIGLGIVLVRNIMERRNEIGLFQAMGYGSRHIFRIFFMEYFLLISIGILSGFISALLATLPGFVSLDFIQAFTSISYILLILFANSIFWISIFILSNLQKRSLAKLNLE